MSFAEWKKRSKKWIDAKPHIIRGMPPSTFEEIVQAAYKSGERQGRRDAEEMAKRAIELREMLKKGVA